MCKAAALFLLHVSYLCRWPYGKSAVLDGNFSQQHRQTRNPGDDVPLADGELFMVKEAPYKEHLKTAKEFKEVGHHKINPLMRLHA